MEKQLARLAVAHVLLIVYAVLSAGIFLKVRYGTGHPDSDGTTIMHIKHYGFWLLSVPAIWSFCCFWEMNKPQSDAETFSNLYLSGVIIGVALFFIAASTFWKSKEPPA